MSVEEESVLIVVMVGPRWSLQSLFTRVFTVLVLVFL